MSTEVGITLNNGIGDKLLDLVGSFILCKYLNYTPHYTFNNGQRFTWGNNDYALELFCFNNIIISNNSSYLINIPNPSTSLCPFRVYEIIHKVLPEFTFKQISDDFLLFSKEIIQPSNIIASNIPKGIEHAYGIHLRRSDKVSYNADIRHENLIDEFESITQHLLQDVEKIILCESASFCIVSEDPEWKEAFTQHIRTISEKHNKPVTFVKIEYENNHFSNYASVLDLFCLSKCKEILQGVKYSTFSIIASILGNHTLRNYSPYTNSHEKCYIHLWSSVLTINNNKNYDLELHRRVSSPVIRIHTNIPNSIINS